MSLNDTHAAATAYLSSLKGREGTLNLQYMFSDRIGLASKYHAHIHIKVLPGDPNPNNDVYHVVNGFDNQPEVAINKAISVLKLILAPKDDDLFS